MTNLVFLHVIIPALHVVWVVYMHNELFIRFMTNITLPIVAFRKELIY